MAQKQTFLNTSLTETAANTINTSQIEVPGSQSAKRVVLVSCKAIVPAPDAVATTWTQCRAAVAVGKQTQTTLLPSERATVVSKNLTMYSAAGPAPVLMGELDKGDLGAPVDIPADDVDKKFYVTAGVLGVSNTAAKTGYFAMRFVVDF